jgi:hypothetical protein
MDKNYSTLLQSKLPSYIVDDTQYTNFVKFFEEYYNWFNDTYNITNFANKIDVDSNYDLFLPYFQADFLPYFPKEIATDKIKLLKLVKELYKSKGISDSFKFLFRALYDSYCEITPTIDFVFKPTNGKWIVPKSIKIESLDIRFLNINNYILFGVQSKTFGTVEFSKINGKYTQIYLSNIERLYFSGEDIKVLDSTNKEIYFLNGKPVEYDTVPPEHSETISAKIIGSLSSINIDSNRRGQFYKIGDPVVITGGINQTTLNPVEAKAEVSEVTLGQISDVAIINGGFGFNVFPDSLVDVIYENQVDAVANVVVSLVDTTKPTTIFSFPIDSIISNYNIQLDSNNFNFTSNANVYSTLANTFAFVNYDTYPVSNLNIKNGGGGYTSKPTLDIKSIIQDTSAQNQILSSFGILRPIEILNGGVNYTANDTIIIEGGDGEFAFAQITNLSANGKITAVEYYSSNNTPYVVGGMGYRTDNLPSITVNSSTGSNAVLLISGIMGTGVEYNLETDRIGAITKIKLTEAGEDYISTPNVSLRIQDIAISNVFNSKLTNTIIYQGISPIYSTFLANPYSFKKVSDELPGFNDDIYLLRVYDYKGTLSSNSTLKLFDTDISEDIGEYNIELNKIAGLETGNKIYGDGSAKATAKFLNGLIIGEGSYLNSDGQPSAFSVFQSDIYNSSTYFLSSEVGYADYKEPVLNLLHPISSRIVPRCLLRSNTTNTQNNSSQFNIGSVLSNNSTISLIPSNTAFSKMYSVSSNISELQQNTYLKITTQNLMNVYSSIESIDTANSIIYLSDFIQYKYSNIYNGTASANSIIIEQDFNNQNYSVNTFIFIGDYVTISGNNYQIINKNENILYFSSNTNMELLANTANSQMITITKPLLSNNITKYLSV